MKIGSKAHNGPRRGLGRTGKLIALGFFACIALGGLTAFVLNTLFPGATSEPNFEVPKGEHPITFYMQLDGYENRYGEGCSRIPVQITGTDSEGNAVDKTIYLAYSGTDTSLPCGDYEARVVGSPITTDGAIFSYDGLAPATFTVSEDLEEDEGYTVKESSHFVLYPIPSDDVTDQQIEDAVAWARKDEELDKSVDIDELEQAARKRRETVSFDTGESYSA